MNIVNINLRLLAGLLCTCFCVIHSIAQNLVPNPSFETLSLCPERLNTTPVLLATPWLTPYNATNNGSFGTADIFNSCSNPSAVGVPANVKGFQYPRTGNGYAGFISWGGGGQTGTLRGSREYLQVQLKTPLVAGDNYYVGFYISLSDRHCAVKEIGLHLSHGPIPPDGETIFNYEPHLESNQGWLNDTSNWVLIDGCYLAEGGEDYLTIGNFRHHLESDLYVPCEDIHLSYYYLDDVFVMNMSNPDLGEDFSLCTGDTFTLNAGGGNTSYSWHDLSMADTFQVTEPGIYYVEVTNICGTASDTIQVSLETNPPQINLPDTLNLCQGDELILDPQIQGVQFLWNDGSNSPQLHVFTPGVYRLTVTNNCGSDVANVIIEDAGTLPTVSLGAVISICPGELLEIQPLTSNVDTWLWSDGSTSSTLNISNAGLIHLTVSNECGSASDTVNVIETSDPPSIDLGADIVGCDGDIVLLQPDVNGVTFLWQDGSMQSSMLVIDSGTFSLQISNACGSSSDTINVDFISPPPFPYLGNDTTLCIGEVLTLHWTGPEDIHIQWENGSAFPFNFVEQSGQYYITANNTCGTSSDTIEVIFIAPPDPISLGNDTLLCPGQFLLLSVPANSEYTITWQDGSHDNDFLANQSQTYSVIVTNQCGIESDEIYVEFENIQLTFPSEDTLSLCPQDLIVLDVTQDVEVEYLWSTGSILPAIEVNTIGNYDVAIYTNCRSETFKFEIIQGLTCDFIPDLFIPNIFSPNEDNVNDLFLIPTMPSLESYDVQLMVYDRWGSLVYSSSILPISWDGTFKNKPLQQGMYTYYLKLVNKFNGDSKLVAGDITIVH